MIKQEKKFALVSLVAVFALLAVVLSGCWFNKTENQITEEPPIDDGAIDLPPVEEDILPEENLTEADLGAEIDDLDLEMEELEITGFEADNLSDKDLGL